jgi:signal transduction histidine kinase
MELFRNTFWITMAVLILISIGVGWFMAKRSLKGFEIVTQTAEEISRGALNKRVIVSSNATEIERLSGAFNFMLDRIDELIIGIKEVIDNIAHELKSPLARIRGLAEVTLSTGRGDERYEKMAASTIEECDHLIEMTNTLLDISERKAGVTKLKMKTVDLVESIQRVCDLYSPLAEEKDIHLTHDLPEKCEIRGDSREIQRLLINLLDNSFKYTPHQGSITVSVIKTGKKVEISVRDTGSGISEEDMPYIFDRFYRGDKSRSEKGFGLGLSLVKIIATDHGGDITATSIPGEGTTFNIILESNE